MKVIVLNDTYIPVTDTIVSALGMLASDNHSLGEYYLHNFLFSAIEEINPGDIGPCQDCIEPGEWAVCPFALEIHDEENWMFLCTECFHERFLDT